MEQEHPITRVKSELRRRQHADAAAVEALVNRSHSLSDAEISSLADCVERRNLDLADLHRRVNAHLAGHDRRQRLERATQRRNELAAELHRRKAFACLLGTVTIEQVRAAAEGGVARFSNDGNLLSLWLRARGWRMLAGGAWRQEGETTVAFDAVKRQSAAELDPIRPALLAHLQSQAATPAPEPVADGADPVDVEASVAALEAELAGVSEIDPGTLQLVIAAEAALGCYGGEASPWLQARGWRIEGAYAIEAASGARMPVMPSAIDSQFKKDVKAVERELRDAVIEAGRKAVFLASKQAAEPVAVTA